MDTLIVVAVGLAFGAGCVLVIARSLGKGFGWRGTAARGDATGLPVVDLAEMQFAARPILNRSEKKLWQIIEAWRQERAPALSLSVQVSLGEFLKTDRVDHFRAINTKRADFVLWDEEGLVRAVIEFDGPGHWGRSNEEAGRARRADEIKNRALASAQIPLLRIYGGYSRDEVLKVLDQLLPYLRPATRTTRSDGAMAR